MPSRGISRTELFTLSRWLQQASRTFKLVHTAAKSDTSQLVDVVQSFVVVVPMMVIPNNKTKLSTNTVMLRPSLGNCGAGLQLGDVVESFNVTVTTQQDTSVVSMLCHVVVISIGAECLGQTRPRGLGTRHLLLVADTTKQHNSVVCKSSCGHSGRSERRPSFSDLSMSRSPNMKPTKWSMKGTPR